MDIRVCRIASMSTEKEKLAVQCLELQSTLTEMSIKLTKCEQDNAATTEKNKMMEELLQDLLFKVGAVKNVGTSPASKAKLNKASSPRNNR